MDEFGKLKKLMSEFKRLPRRLTDEPTLLEISKFPHYENVCSNILAFYLSPEEPHQLDNVVLCSLLRAAGVKVDDSMLQVEWIGREVGTKAGGRLDLLVETNAYIIGIENKIWATVNNDLSDYYLTLVKYGENKKRNPIGLLLSLKPIEPPEGSLFKNVIYQQFFDVLLREIGPYAVSGNRKYVEYLFDFVRTIQNLTRDRMIDHEFLNFAKKEKKNINLILRRITDLRRGIKDKVSQLHGVVSFEQENVSSSWVYQAQDYQRIEAAFVTDIRLGANNTDPTIAVDTVLSPDGWEIRIFRRRGNLTKGLPELLRELRIETHPLQDEILKDQLVYDMRLSFESGIKEVAEVLRNVVKVIAGAGGRM